MSRSCFECGRFHTKANPHRAKHTIERVVGAIGLVIMAAVIIHYLLFGMRPAYGDNTCYEGYGWGGGDIVEVPCE